MVVLATRDAIIQRTEAGLGHGHGKTTELGRGSGDIRIGV